MNEPAPDDPALSEQGLSEQGLSEQGLSEQGLSEHALNEHGLNAPALSGHALDEHGPFGELLAVEGSELAGALRDGLRLLARALDQTALLNPDDPGAEAYGRARAALYGLLAGDGPAAPRPVPAEAPAAGPVAEPAAGPDPVAELFDRFHADRAVREHLGETRRLPDPARQWLAFNCALLRLPRKTAENWRAQAAAAVPPAAGGPAATVLPALDVEEELILPWPDQGIGGVRTALGADPHPEVARALGDRRDPAVRTLAALASQMLTLAALDPDAFYFESLTPQPRPLADPAVMAEYTRELLTRLDAVPSVPGADPLRSLEALVAADEALCSVAHLPPAADPASWRNALAARSHELVFAQAAGLAGRARVREPARRFRDVRDLTEDDVPVVSRAHPGRVIWCLRLYSELDGLPRRGRVVYGVDR
ncbi:hypothetical protein [Spirillospora sp. NPDC029432]|uniref:hypothetical protein n=1 Tax=Spirillospora sp. NPDC029432 TaxID=3154599 RepID=UPI0034564D4C